MIKSANDVINTYEQSCVATDVKQTNKIIIENGCNVTGTGGVIINSGQAINLYCMQDITTRNNVGSSISQTMQQAAEAIVQQFAFGTVADANNFITQSIIIGNNMVNGYYSTCLTKDLYQDNTIVCNGGTIGGLVEINSLQTSTSTCIQKAATDNTAYIKAVSLLSQSAVAKQQATFVYLLFAIVAVLAVGAWFVVSVADTPAVQWTIVGLILFFVISSVIYAFTAKDHGNYPYVKG
jgi:hypothetical protein